MLLGGQLRSTLACAFVLVPLIHAASVPAFAQDATQTPEALAVTPASIVPQQVRYAGKLPTRPGETVEAQFRIYAAPEGGDPLWTETQQITTTEDGSYSVLLGGASPTGLPQTVFAGGAARWLGVSVDRSPEQERNPLSSVPYAMKSADAESLSGHAASDFVTQTQLAQFAQASAQAGSQPNQTGSPTPAITPLTSGTVTGSGTAGTVPLWTGALTQGNSEITQVGSDIGINETAPTATLDVNGSENVRGLLYLPPLATATSTVGQRSQLLQLGASAWSSTANAPVTPTFKILTNFVNNDTSSAAGQLEFHYSQGTSSVSVLSIAGDGFINFAPTQTFPGTISSITAGTGIQAATSGNKVTLSIDPTVIPTLAAANSFSGNDSFMGNTSMTSANTANALTAINSDATAGNAIFASSDKGIGVLGQSFYSNPGNAGVFGYFNTKTQTASSLTANWAAGVWGDAVTGIGSSPNLAGVIGTADTASAGIFANNSSTSTTLFAQNSGTGNGIVATSNGGTGISASSNGGTAIQGAASADVGTAGILGSSAGQSNTRSSLLNLYLSGVWGDTSASRSSTLPYPAGVIGTSDSGYAGFFQNNATNGFPAVQVISNGVNSEAIQAIGFGNGAPGLLAQSSSDSGVLAITDSGNAGTAGVLGTAWEESNTYLAVDTTWSAGVWGDTTANGSGRLVRAGVIGTADSATAGFFENNSPASTLQVINASSGPTGLFKTFMASTPDGTCGIGDGGDLSCTGRMKSLVSVHNGARKVETYAPQSAENWMEDYGTGLMKRGVALVKIDPAFAETISESADYHVFLTPNADAEALYVINRTATSFEVRESKGGTSSLTFDYKIVAKRRGYEAQRLKDVTDSFNAAQPDPNPPPSPLPSNSTTMQHRNSPGQPAAIPTSRPTIPNQP